MTTKQESLSLIKSVHRLDCVFACLAFLLGFLWVLWLCESSGLQLVRIGLAGQYFQSDTWRAYDDMAIFDASHYRTNVHGWFSLFWIPIISLIEFFGFHTLRAIWIANAITAGLWSVGLWIAGRSLGARRPDALLIPALGLSMSASMLWFTVPETYPSGSLGIVLCFLIGIGWAKKYRLNILGALAGAFAMGMTLSNATALGAQALGLGSWRKCLVVLPLSIAIYFAGFLASRALFPQPPSVRISNLASDSVYVYAANPERIKNTTRSMLVYTLAAPTPELEPEFSLWSVQQVPLGAMSTLTAGSAIAWWLLISVSIAVVIVGRTSIRARGPVPMVCLRAVLLYIAAHTLLHIVYGEESFLYSIHLAPAIALFCGFVFFIKDKYLWPVRALAIVVIGLSIANNFALINHLTSVKTIDDERAKRLSGFE